MAKPQEPSKKYSLPDLSFLRAQPMQLPNTIPGIELPSYNFGFQNMRANSLPSLPTLPNLTGVATGGQPATPDRKTVAQQILSGMNWTPSDPIQTSPTVNDPRGQSVMSSIFDLLSIGNFGVMNAVDEGWEAVNSEKDDSFLESLGEGTLGAIKGFAKGVGAGLRGFTGAFGADWSSDPTDKTRTSDIIYKYGNVLPTERDENGNWYFKDDPNRKYNAMEYEFLKQDAKFPVAGLGLAGDIFLDPLTYTGFGLGKLGRLIKGDEILEEGLSAAQKEKGIGNVAKEAPEGVIPNAGKATGDIAGLDRVTEGTKFWGNTSPTITSRAQGEAVSEAGRQGIRVPAQVVSGVSQATERQIASRVATALKGGPESLTAALEKVFARLPYELHQFPNLAAKLEDIRAAGPEFWEQFGGKGSTATVNAYTDAIANVIRSDVEAARGVRSARQVVDDVAAGTRLENPALAATDVARELTRSEGLQQFVSKAMSAFNIGLGKATGKSDPIRFEEALKNVRLFEFQHGSAPVAMSKIIEQIGPKLFENNPQFVNSVLKQLAKTGRVDSKLAAQNPKLATDIENAFNASKAAKAIVDAPKVEHGIAAGEDMLAATGGVAQSPIREAITLSEAAKLAAQVTKAAKGSNANAKLAQSYIRNMHSPRTAVESAMVNSANKTKTVKALDGSSDFGHMYQRFSNAPSVTRAIEKNLGSLKQAAKYAGPGAKTLEWLGSRFYAAYRNEDLHDILLRGMASAKFTVSLRAKEVNALARKLGRDGELWKGSWQVATGAKAMPTSPEEREIAEYIMNAMESILGNTGFRQQAIIENTVVGRAQLLRKELNANLRYFGLNHEFSNGIVHSLGGTAHDLSKGLDWMQSWKHWNVENPLQFIYQFQNAVEHTVRERTILDELVERFGSRVERGSSLSKSTLEKFPYLNGVRFHPDVIEQAEYMLKGMSNMKSTSGELLRQVDHVTSKWKAAVTIYKPSHYIRNLIGDVFFNWIAGVNGVKSYSTAIKVMKAQKGRYQWDDIGELAAPGALQKAAQRAATGELGKRGSAGNEIAFTMKNGRKITNDMVYAAAFEQGILTSARVTEETAEAGTRMNILDKIHLPGKHEGQLHNVVSNIHEQRDHFIRIAHFVDLMKKSRLPFDKAVVESGKIVRKWHPDGTGLTSFERDVMKRVFPFYSWTRKSIPLVLESIVTQPAKVGLYPKLQWGAQQFGLENPTEDWGDPFPIDQLWPEYLKEKGIGPVAGSYGDYTFLNPGNPVQDTIAEFGNMLQAPDKMMEGTAKPTDFGGIIGLLSPVAKIPMEAATGTSTLTGGPIRDWSKYATDQVPGVSDLSRISNLDLGGTSPKFDEQGLGNPVALFNLLSGMGMIQTDQSDVAAGSIQLNDWLKRRYGNG